MPEKVSESKGGNPRLHSDHNRSTEAIVLAVRSPITAGMAGEAPLATPVSSAFAALIPDEIEFAEVNFCFDRAFQDWLRDTELAHEQLTTELDHFHTLPRVIPEDRPLQEFAQLLDAAIGHEEPGGARQLCRELHFAFFSRFQIAGIGPTAMHHNRMLLEARHLMTALVALPLFDGAVIEDDDEDPDAGLGCDL